MSKATPSTTSIRELTLLALLTALITISGIFKIPNLIPGLDFQLSAPIAVAICAAFGFKRYIIAGILSSLIGLLLGTQNLLNVAIAMQFRLIVGFLLWATKNHMLMIIFAGPIASTMARLFLSFLVGKPLTLGIIAVALPGFIFTAILSSLFTILLRKVNKTYGIQHSHA